MGGLPKARTLWWLAIIAALLLPGAEAFPWGGGCTNPTQASMSANPNAVCVGGGTTHTITVTARDLDGMKSIEISGNGVSKTCTYDPPTTEWQTCQTTWSSVGKAAGAYSFTAAITDVCDNVYGTNCTVSVMGGAIRPTIPAERSWCSTTRRETRPRTQAWPARRATHGP